MHNPSKPHGADVDMTVWGAVHVRLERSRRLARNSYVTDLLVEKCDGSRVFLTLFSDAPITFAAPTSEPPAS